MNITELIQRLEEVKKAHGELQVKAFDVKWDTLFPINKVDVIDECDEPKYASLD